jgi:hypothetical protein
MLKPSSPNSLDQITVNGKKLSSIDGVLLKPNDRIIFGTHCVFLFKDPSNPAGGSSMPDTDADPITWENVQMERSNIEDASSKQA